MRFIRTMMSWILLAAMLVSLPGGSVGHFVCTRGMAAGPACPLCHGHANAKQTGAELGNNCCKFVTGPSTPNSHLALAQVEKPIRGNLSMLPAGTSQLIPLERELTASAWSRASPRTPTSRYLSTSLRL